MGTPFRWVAWTALSAAPAVLDARAAMPERVLEFDWDAFRIGIAEYEQGPTGATVFHFPKPVVGVVDVRGGSPGAIDTLAAAEPGRR